MTNSMKFFVLSGVALLLCLVILFLGGAWSSNVQASDAASESGERLLTIHDGSEDRGILTHATTLREAFKEANIPIDSNDLVEPGLDETLTANNYDINIYRARPITVVDGAIHKKIMSAYRTPEQIVTHAGMTLHDEDVTTTSLPTDIASEGTAIQLTITRATPFTLVLYGKKTTAYTRAKTVGDMLKEKHIIIGHDDTLSANTEAPLTAGMDVELWRNGKQTVTQDEDMPFNTNRIQDFDHEVGYHEIKTPGVVGKRTVTYEIEMKNGVEVSRKEIQSVVTAQPKDQVEVVGMKATLPAGSHQDWMAAAGISSGDFGYVEYIVAHEGGWEPCKVQGGAIDCSYAINGGRSGYGIVQATPGAKMASAGADWATNPITQLKWANSYAQTCVSYRMYCGWEGAYNYWVAHHNW